MVGDEFQCEPTVSAGDGGRALRWLLCEVRPYLSLLVRVLVQQPEASSYLTLFCFGQVSPSDQKPLAWTRLIPKKISPLHLSVWAGIQTGRVVGHEALQNLDMTRHLLSVSPDPCVLVYVVCNEFIATTLLTVKVFFLSASSWISS